MTPEWQLIETLKEVSEKHKQRADAAEQTLSQLRGLVERMRRAAAEKVRRGDMRDDPYDDMAMEYKWKGQQQKCDADELSALLTPDQGEAHPCVDLMEALRRALPIIWHTCHDMNPPFPGPCGACERERADALRQPVHPTAIHAANDSEPDAKP